MRNAERLSEKEVYRGRVLRLSVETIRLPGGGICELELIRHPGAAAVVPVDDEGRILLVRQYRHATGGWILEVPAGKLDHGESPETCAAREVEEETGSRTKALVYLGWIWTTPGFTDEKIWLFLARNVSAGKQDLQPDEALSVEKVPIEQALEMARSGEISDAKSVCALLRAASHLL